MHTVGPFHSLREWNGAIFSNRWTPRASIATYPFHEAMSNLPKYQYPPIGGFHVDPPSHKEAPVMSRKLMLKDVFRAFRQPSPYRFIGNQAAPATRFSSFNLELETAVSAGSPGYGSYRFGPSGRAPPPLSLSRIRCSPDKPHWPYAIRLPKSIDGCG